MMTEFCLKHGAPHAPNDCAECDLAGEIERLLAERHADRVAVMSLADALPRCTSCVKPATWEHGDPYEPTPACDEHVTDDDAHRWALPYAEQLRAFVARMSVWLGEGPR